MPTYRLEAFTDGVLAIVITIMVLELNVPVGGRLSDLSALAPIMFAYVLSFVNVGIYWSNHHHLLQVADRIDGRVLWSNLVLLFWLSLLPFMIRWLDASNFSTSAAAGYGVVLTMASASWMATKHFILACEQNDFALSRAIGRDRKSWFSVSAYAVSTLFSFYHPLLAISGYVLTTIAWLVPDRRLERVMQKKLELG